MLVGHFIVWMVQRLFGSSIAVEQLTVWFPSHVSISIFESSKGDGSPMPLVPYDRPYTNFSRFVCGMLMITSV